MTKRPLLFCAIFLFFGVAAVLFDINIWIFVLIVAAGGLLLLFSDVKRAITFLLAGAIFFSCGVLRATVSEENRRKTEGLYSSKEMECTLTVTDFSDEGKVVAFFNDRGKKIKVYLNDKSKRQLYPGDIISGKISFHKPLSDKVGRSGFDTYLYGRNVFIYASCDNTDVVGTVEKGMSGWIFAIRRRINDMGFLSFGEKRRAFFNAMVLGDKRLLSDDMSKSLQGAGLNHIAVVSGMHLSVLLSLIAGITNRLFGRRRIGAVIAILSSIFITLATGAGASVVRACIMCSFYQVARLFYRENDSLSALSLSAGAMCLFNPYIIYSAGFVLSVLSAMGILLYGKKMTAFFSQFLPPRVSEAVAVSLAAQSTVIVAVIGYFNIVTPYALLSNVLIFPFATAFVMLGMAFSVFSQVAVISHMLKFLLCVVSDVICFVCDGISALPGAVVSVTSPSMQLLVIWIFVLLFMLLYPRRKKALLWVGCIALVGLSLCIFSEKAAKDDVKISFLPYGAKATSCVSLPEGGVFLVDCIDAYDTKALLDKHAKESFDCVILTSAKEKTALSLVEEGLIKELVLPDELYTQEKKKEILQKAAGCNARAVFLPRGKTLFENGAFIEFFSAGNTENENPCVKIEYKGKRFITLQSLKGKGIEVLCREKVAFDADCLKIPFAPYNEKTDLSSLCKGAVIISEKEFNIK